LESKNAYLRNKGHKINLARLNIIIIFEIGKREHCALNKKKLKRRTKKILSKQNILILEKNEHKTIRIDTILKKTFYIKEEVTDVNKGCDKSF
jgi:hypothetical protein